MIMYTHAQLMPPVQQITELRFECLPHPTFSADHEPCDCHVFGLLKETLDGKRFRTDKDTKESVHKWLHSQ